MSEGARYTFVAKSWTQNLDTKMDDATPLEEEGLVMLALTTRGTSLRGSCVAHLCGQPTAGARKSALQISVE